MNNYEELKELAQQVDKILKEELERVGIEYTMAEVRIYDVKTVGVQGDERTYTYPAEIELRQNKNFVWKPSFTQRLSTRITNEVRNINRVLYVIPLKE